MARHRTKKHSRRHRMRGGWEWSDLNPFKSKAPVTAPVVAASEGVTSTTAAVKEVAPLPSPAAQSSALALPAPSASDPILGPDASTAAVGGRRRTRKHKRKHSRRR